MLISPVLNPLKHILSHWLKRFLFSCGIISLKVFISLPVQAEIVPDGSLNTINTNGNITGGLTTSNGTTQNLFHSFEEFSLSSTDTITFIAPNSVENIITRVTGGSLSQIDGTLQISNTTSNLFLINPAGIAFGPTAQLKLPGSFVAATAERALFSNGFAFDVASANTPPLMTVSAPIGLQMGSGQLSVNNAGHSLAIINPRTEKRGGFAPYAQIGDTRGLQTFRGRTMALIGSGVEFDGGLATANSGNLEIGSVSPGSFVSLSPIPLGFLLDYSQVQAFEEITFSNRSLANVSGIPAKPYPTAPFQIATTPQGNSQIVGENITFQETSLLLSQSGIAATRTGGNLRVTATDTLTLSGSDRATTGRSGIFSETIGPMASGAIEVNANNIELQSGAGIISFTFSDADSGNVTIGVGDQLTVSGHNLANPQITSTVATGSVVSGLSGNIGVKPMDKDNPPDILLIDGGSLTSLNLGSGSAGDLSVTADAITVTGRVTASNIPSALSVSNYGSGEAGDIEIGRAHV